jgi:hypothetical protein
MRKLDWTFFIIVVTIVVGITVLASPTQDLVKVYVDSETGCEYFITPGVNGFTPRADSFGYHKGCFDLMMPELPVRKPVRKQYRMES